MKYIHKIAGIHLLLLSTAFTYSMGDNSLKLAPITMGDGLITFVPVPNISLKGSSTVNLIVGKPYVELGVLAVDGIQIESLTKTGSVNIYKPGTYSITYTVIDTNGQKSILTREVVVSSLDALLPHDTNLYYAPYSEKGYLYFADPRPPENGKNRVIRVNYETMTFDENNDSVDLVDTNANLIPGKEFSNPHSVDRAGKTNKFYVRTQNAYSFDVVAAENGQLVYKKSVPLSVNINGTDIPYSPRAFGAYNAKYDIQLLSARNSLGYNIVSIVDVKTDEILKVLYKSVNASATTVTGHAKWLNEDYFTMIDRGNHSLDVYKVFKNSTGKLDAQYISSLDTVTPLHAIDRVKNPESSEDLNTFYLLGTSADINGAKYHPFVSKTIFNPTNGTFATPLVRQFNNTDYLGLANKNLSATTHHMNISPDGQDFVVPVYDGKIYKVNRKTMQITASLDTGAEKGLGAAHIEFSTSLNLAIITNHWSPYITLIDTSNNGFSLKGFLKIYRDGHHDVFDPNEIHLMQPHFAQMSEDGKYFYTFASQDNGRFVKVNLEEVLKLSKDANNVFQFDNNSDDSKAMKSIYVEGAPEQAHS